MGRERESASAPKHSASRIEIRTLNDGRTSMRIPFTYRGVRCRETIKLAATKQNIKYAENLRAEILNAIERGTFNYASYFPNSKRAKLFGHVDNETTLETMLLKFLETSEKVVEYSTYEGYRKVIKGHLIPKFGTIKISDLKSFHIQNFVRELNRTYKTTRNVLIPLRAIVDQAIIEGKIEKNPFFGVKINKLIAKEHRKSKFKVEPFIKDEIKSILNSAPTELEKNLYKFALFSGLRTSELIALKWKNVNLGLGIVKVVEAIVCNREKETKTEAGMRDVTLLPQAMEALKRQKKLTFRNDEDFVFISPETNKRWLNNGQIRKTSWTPLLRKAKVKYRNPYQTRHTYASMMLSKGENIIRVAKEMGHANIKMLIETYGKWIPEETMSLISGRKFNYNWEGYLEE